MNKSIFLSLALFLFFATSTIFSQEVPKTDAVPDYIRFEDDKLLTAVSRFEKDGNIVDLIAVVHMADKAYFQALNKSLVQYDAVLYEMVGGPYTEEMAKQKQKAEGDMGQIQGMQKMVTGMLGLVFQLDHINYSPANFVHADMSAEEFMKLTDGGQIFSNLIGKVMQLSQTGELKNIPGLEGDPNQMMQGLVMAVMSGDSDALKRTLGPILAEAESLIAQLEGDEESVLIAKRNKVAIDVLNKLDPKASRKDAILYGGGHMPDLEARLLKMGYKKTSTNWQAGWVLGQPKAASDEPQTLDLQKLMEQVGPLMEMMRENSK